MLKQVCAAVLACALAGACTVREEKTVVVPAGTGDACVAYGFTPGTSAYNNCVAREADARRRGRMARDYAETALVSDAQAACYSYGLVAGSPSFERCVRAEIDARRYR